jgi:hypothetical protein
MVEAAAVLGIFSILAVCTLGFFLMSIDKVRSLDAVYHTARACQVGKTGFATIAAWCFGRSAGITRTHLVDSGPPAVEEISFSFFPRGLRRMQAWKSVMRVTPPQHAFLARSWPGAPEDLH